MIKISIKFLRYVSLLTVLHFQMGQALTMEVDPNGPNVQRLFVGKRDNFIPVTNYFGITKVNKLPEDSTKGKGTTVIIIDSAIDSLHPSFEGRLTTDSIPGPTGKKSYHGTNITGNIHSIVPEASIKFISYLHYIEQGLSRSKACALALKEATDSKGNIVNISLDLPQTAEVRDALILLLQSGKIVIKSFGNNFESQNGDHSKKLLEFFKDPQFMNRIRLVSSTCYDGISETLAPYSDRAVKECSFSLSAPGTNILSLMPRGKFNKVCSGTSPATAVVTAIFDLLMDNFPGLSPEDYLSVLDKSTRRKDLKGRPLGSEYGLGIIDAFAAYEILKQMWQPYILEGDNKLTDNSLPTLEKKSSLPPRGEVIKVVKKGDKTFIVYDNGDESSEVESVSSDDEN